MVGARADGLGVASGEAIGHIHMRVEAAGFIRLASNMCYESTNEREEYQMQKNLTTLALGVGGGALASGAYAQSGSVAKAVSGYSFEDAAKEDPATKDFHSADGHLTFAIVTHTAGNGFFDPVYVGATVAANMIGAKVLLLGSESPADDPAREIEILNQIIQDPTHRRPDHDHAAGRRL